MVIYRTWAEEADMYVEGNVHIKGKEPVYSRTTAYLVLC